MQGQLCTTQLLRDPGPFQVWFCPSLVFFVCICVVSGKHKRARERFRSQAWRAAILHILLSSHMVSLSARGPGKCSSAVWTRNGRQLSDLKCSAFLSCGAPVPIFTTLWEHVPAHLLTTCHQHFCAPSYSSEVPHTVKKRGGSCCRGSLSTHLLETADPIPKPQVQMPTLSWVFRILFSVGFSLVLWGTCFYLFKNYQKMLLWTV